jgi:hypothetical protein
MIDIDEENFNYHITVVTLLYDMILCFYHQNKSSGVNEGEIMWTSDSIGENLESAPIIDEKDNVFVIGGGSVHPFDGRGNRRRNIFINAVDFNTPFVIMDNQTLYCGGLDILYALNAASGKIGWKSGGFPAGFHFVPAVSSDNSRIYRGDRPKRDCGDINHCFDSGRKQVKKDRLTR